MSFSICLEDNDGEFMIYESLHSFESAESFYDSMLEDIFEDEEIQSISLFDDETEECLQFLTRDEFNNPETITLV
mgnify:FL=1